ncbi:sensor histidine kinase [Yinghuangia sp. YIM S09857]|uniref:sensor histidine kinase n=1 Tax=Yinghuangia sp. YIM S09857 TaxID=3436929 RepID=UPI003F53E3B6
MNAHGRPLGAARRWFRQFQARRSVVFDCALAAVTTGVELGLTFEDSNPVRAFPAVLIILGGTVLLARRVAPEVVLGLACAVAAVLTVTGQHPGGAPALVALYTVAEVRQPRVSLVALASTGLYLQLAGITVIPVAVGTWGLGAYAQTRRRYTLALEERTAQLEREREQLSVIAAQQERTALARELHDIVAHSVTVMLLGVRGARDVLRTAPDVADETLERVETTGEESVAELRRMLLLLRGPDQSAHLHPQPSLAQLAALVASYDAAGLPTRLKVTGEARPLAGGLELSVYRIVEEALTNVLKHAEPTHVVVTLGFGRTHLDVSVVNDTKRASQPRISASAAASPSAIGHGIVGMRERVSVLGGELEALPEPDGGFRIAARLPLAGSGAAGT